MCFRRQLLSFAATLATLALSAPAQAELLVNIDKSTQQMTVSIDGVPRYVWPVSSGGRGYDTPSGEFKPFRMDKDHFSREWDDAPMPYSIFFTMNGIAVHGTYETKNLGKAVSHGCVRLSREHAATLWSLVKEQKMANTKVVIGGEIPGGAGTAVARQQPSYQRDYRSDDRYYYRNDQTASATQAAPAGAGRYGPTYYDQNGRPYYYWNGRSYYYQRAQPGYDTRTQTYGQDGGTYYGQRPQTYGAQTYGAQNPRPYGAQPADSYYAQRAPRYDDQSDQPQSDQPYVAQRYYRAPAPFPFGW